MSEFNFKSQICTTREQSERLLSLGLKKETADMSIGHTGLLYPYLHSDEEDRVFTPAWSLHRLLSMLPKAISVYNEVFACERLAYFSILEDYCVIYGDDSDGMVHKIFH